MGKITEKCNTETESHYKSLTRFVLLNSFGNLWYYILCYGLDLLNLKLDVCYLDGTEWYIGSFRLPILVLAVDHQGIAIPINATIIKAYCQNMNGFIFWKIPVNVAS